jgi:hypothetical protein
LQARGEVPDLTPSIERYEKTALAIGIGTAVGSAAYVIGGRLLPLSPTSRAVVAKGIAVTTIVALVKANSKTAPATSILKSDPTPQAVAEALQRANYSRAFLPAWNAQPADLTRGVWVEIDAGDCIAPLRFCLEGQQILVRQDELLNDEASAARVLALKLAQLHNPLMVDWILYWLPGIMDEGWRVHLHHVDDKEYAAYLKQPGMVINISRKEDNTLLLECKYQSHRPIARQLRADEISDGWGEALSTAIREMKDELTRRSWLERHIVPAS